MAGLKYHYSNPKFAGKPWLVDELAPKKRKKRKGKKERRRFKKHRKAAQQDITPRIVEYKKAIDEFWITFNGCKTTHDRLQLLCRFANPPWKRIDNNLRLLMRKKFGRNWSKLLAGIGPECGCCEVNRWTEKHHIVPLGYGGLNENRNLLAICPTCHDVIHPWMAQ